MPRTPESAPLVLRRILGRNSGDNPLDLPENHAVTAINVDFYAGGLCRKRLGASAVTLNGFAAATNRVHGLFRYLPSDDETLAELYAVESNALTTVQRLAGGTTWATQTLANAFILGTNNTASTEMVNFNGKFYIAGKTAVNRLQVVPSSGGTIRRVGLAVPAAPAAPTLAAGAVTDTRKYAVCWTEQSSGTTIRRSNLSPLTAAVALSAQQATITRPTLPGDGETHWELFGFVTGDSYTNGYLIATTASGTTTAVDNTATLSGVAPPLAGANTPPPSAKYLLVDGNRLLMAGAWETSAGTGITPSVRRLWWTPRLGTSASDGDSERISDTTAIKGYMDFDAPITGLAGPIDGNIYVFGPRTIWKLIPTDQVDAPYVRLTVRQDIGCVRHRTIVLADDENGAPAIYWLSHKGPYRVGRNGIEYIGRDVEDYIATRSTVATQEWTMYVPHLHQVWFHIANTSAQVVPNVRWVFDTRLGRVVELNGMSTVHNGWSTHTGTGVTSSCGVLFANTLGAAMSLDLQPYLGNENTTSAAIWKHNTGYQDAGAGYQGSLTTRPYAVSALENVVPLNDVWLEALASTGVTMTLLVRGDFTTTNQQTFTASIASSDGNQTRVVVKFEGVTIGDNYKYLQFVLQDGSENAGWTADALLTKLDVAGVR